MEFPLTEPVGVGSSFVIGCDRSKPQLVHPATQIVPPNAIPKHAIHSKELWESHRNTIEELWVKQGLSFKQMAEILAKDYDFLITKRQFDKIKKQWKLRKYMRKEEMMAIVHTRRKRAKNGQTITVKVNGNSLPETKIERWEHRHKDDECMFDVEPTATPVLQYIEFSPEPSQEICQTLYYSRYGPNSGIWSSPKLSRVVNLLHEDASLNCDDIPLLMLDSSVEDSLSMEYTFSFEKEESAQETTSMALTNSHRPTLTPDPFYVQKAYGIFLTCDISPFPEVPTSPNKYPLSSSLVYKSTEEMLFKKKLLQLKQQDRDKTSEFFDTLLQLAEVFIQQRRYVEAERICRRIFSTREQELGYNHKETLKAAGNLASAIYFQGRHSEAEPHIRRLYEAAPRVFGPDHELSIGTTMLMSNIALKFGNVEEMKRLAREVLQICLQTYGPRHEHAIRAICHLAQQLETEERIALCRAALEICNNSGGHLLEAGLSAQREIAFALRSKGEYGVSMELFGDVLRKCRDIYEPQNRALLQSQSEFSHSLIFVDRSSDAEKLSRQTFLQQRKIGFASYEGLYTMEVYAYALENLERFPEAEERFIKIVNALERMCGKFNQDAAAVIEDIGNLYEKQNRTDDIIALYLQKYSEFEAAGKENTSGARILYLLARTLCMAERYEEAIFYFRKLIKTQINLVGETHDDTLVYYEWLGDCYGDQKKWDQQLEVYEEKHKQLQSSAVENEYTLRIWYLYAMALRSVGRDNDFEQSLIDLLERQDEVLGLTNETTLDTYEYLGDYYDNARRFDDQIKLYQKKYFQLVQAECNNRRSLKICFLLPYSFFKSEKFAEAADYFKMLIEKQEKILGQTHKNTLNSYHWLTSCYRRQKIYDKVANFCLEKIELFLSTQKGEGPEFCRLILALSRILYRAGYPTYAASGLKYAIPVAEELYGQNSIEVVEARFWLGRCHDLRKRYTAALEAYEVAYEGFEKLKVAGEDVDEDIVEALVEDIKEMRQHIENGDEEDMESEDDEEEEGSEVTDLDDDEGMWEEIIDVDLGGLESLIPPNILTF